MTIIGTRFGDIEYEACDVVDIVDGLIGFASATRFVIVKAKAGSNFQWLQCVTQPQLAFLVTDPACFVRDYRPSLGESVEASLGLDKDCPRLFLTTVNIPPGQPSEMTLNLAGPVVINLRERKGRQVVLEEGAYTTKHRVFQSVDRVSESLAA